MIVAQSERAAAATAKWLESAQHQLVWTGIRLHQNLLFCPKKLREPQKLWTRHSHDSEICLDNAKLTVAKCMQSSGGKYSKHVNEL